MKRNMLVSLVFATVLFAIPALSHAQVIVCNLHGNPPFGCSGTIPGVSYTLPSPNPPVSNSCAAGTWYNVVVTVDLKPAYGKQTAFFTVEYEGTPSLWTVDIGDSSTDDGYGGNSGGPERAAEVQVVNQLLSVFDDNTGVPGQVDQLLTQQLSLINGSLKFGVADQILAVGQPRTILQTPVTKHLFTIPDTSVPLIDQFKIYGGFNRVVNLIPFPARIGCGVRWVTIWTGTNPPGV